jgi:hypothetical protein
MLSALGVGVHRGFMRCICSVPRVLVFIEVP